jgi:hypothetical protein
LDIRTHVDVSIQLEAQIEAFLNFFGKLLHILFHDNFFQIINHKAFFTDGIIQLSQ